MRRNSGMKPSIVLIGKTGSGKSVQGQAVAKHLGVPFISSGAIAREMAKKDEDTDMALKSGLLAPEEEMRRAVRAQVEQASVVHGGFVLDGFPRTVAQLICLLSWTSEEPIFFLLDISDLDVITRLLERARQDDNADAIARKLRAFREETQELIDLLDTGNALWEVPAARKREQVTDAILRRIERLSNLPITRS
jgi:adenylate kinase